MVGSRPMARLKIGFIPIEGGEYYKEALEEVTRAEELGLDSVWMEEHHSVTNHYWPSPLTVLAGFATRTSRMMLGTDIIVAAFHHPVRLAEDIAMLDVMSAGRITLGIAIGYKPDEFALYGVDLEKRGARFEEQLAIIKGLWTQEHVSFKGAYYTVDGRLEPKPVTRPHPPVWIGGWGRRQLRRAATLGDAWLPGPVGTLTEIVERQAVYDEHVRDAGGDPQARARPLIRDVIVAKTDEHAWSIAAGSVLPSWYDTYVESEHVLVGRETSGARIADPRDLAADRLIVGDPEGVAQQLAHCIETLACNHLVIRLKLPGLEAPQMTEMLHVLGREVLPELREEAQ